ncbi:MAG: hypothetical protein ACXVAW_05415 [Vulcanimicrobiaceae bacterium]
MNEPPRRRRSSGYTPGERNRGGGFPLWPLLIVIVVLGFFIGGVLARFLGSPKIAMNQKTVQPTPLPTVQFTQPPSPTPSPEPTEPPLPSARPTVSALPSIAKAPKAVAVAPTPTVAPAPTQSPTPRATPEPTPAATPTPPPRRTEPIARKPEPTTPPATAPPAPRAAPTDASGSVVRSYINALANGNRTGAQQYLASGSVDQDSFIDGSAEISNLRESRNSDGSSKVDVDLNTASGKYLITFTVSSGRITDHTATKP